MVELRGGTQTASRRNPPSTGPEEAQFKKCIGQIERIAYPLEVRKFCRYWDAIIKWPGVEGTCVTWFTKTFIAPTVEWS